MKKLLLSLIAGAALTAGTVALAQPASASPVGLDSNCAGHTIFVGVYVDPDQAPPYALSTCQVTNLIP